ncbi:MAG TPA: glycosyltransferase family 4 protein [Candidatus Acidoferrales bacterium]|nr:glycosyltransferase family 4 protein [Candidatus Acidoferrales bacterium]
MRILVAHDVPSEHVGGMNRIMRFTHEPFVALGHQVDYFTAENVGGHSFFARRFAFPHAVFEAAVSAFRAGRGYDIVNVHEAQAAWISLLKHRAGNPYVVVTAHGSEHRAWEFALEEARHHREAPGLKTRILNPLTRLWQIKLGLTRADHIFCLNEDDRSYFASRMKIAPERLTRIFPGADLGYTVVDPLRLSRPVKRILFAGTWRKNKGIEDLVPAFTNLATRHPELWLVILGGGLSVKEIRQKFPSTVADRVETFETSGDSENLTHFDAADIFLLPSLLEGTPLALMEAMAAALPVVTTATCGMKDVIRDHDNGLLVPIRQPDSIVNAIERLIADPALRIDLACNAQRDIKARYKWTDSSQHVLAAYERIVAADRQWLRAKPVPAEKRHLKFCFVSNFTPEWNAGAAGSILAIGTELESAGHAVRYRWKELKWNSTLTNLFVLPWKQYRQVKGECRASQPDVVVVSQPFAYPVFERLKRQFPKTVFLNLTHGWEHRYDIAESTFGWQSDMQGLSGWKRRLAMAARAHICRRIALAMDGLLAPCALDGQFVLRQYGVPQNKLLLMTYGLGPSFGDELRREPHSGLRMLFFGQYVPRKGSLIMERLLPRLAVEFPDAQVTFVVPREQVGLVNGAYRDAFGDRLRVYPWMSRNEVIRICREHDIFLFPSMLEGFGKTFLEAMACGLCVVGFEEGGLPTVAENQVEAMYCKPGDEAGFEQLLRQCLSDPERARMMGQRARAKALQLTWTKTAQTLEAFCVDRLRQKNEANAWAANGQPGLMIPPSSGSSRGCIASTPAIAEPLSIETPVSCGAEALYSEPLSACTPASAASLPAE